MAPSSKRTGYDPFKVKMVGSTPPGAIQFIGSESLAIWEEEKAIIKNILAQMLAKLRKLCLCFKSVAESTYKLTF